MKVFVDEIDKQVLFSIYKHFLTEDEIVFIAYDEQTLSTDDCKRPYFIEENIKDLDQVIAVCHQVDNNQSPINKLVSWDEFALFWLMIMSIYKQRPFNDKLSDLQYLYKKYKNEYDIKLTNYQELYPEYKQDMEVIVGHSEIGVMYLEKTKRFFEHTLTIEYEKRNIFGKKIKRYTHWHPRNLFMAEKDLKDFMTNNEKMKKRIHRHFLSIYF